MEQNTKNIIKKFIQQMLENNEFKKEKILEDINKYVIPMWENKGHKFSEKGINFEIDKALRQYQSTAYFGDTLVSDDSEFDKDWLENSQVDFNKDDSYLKQYIDYLYDSGFAGGNKNIINNIKDTSKNIIKYCGNPGNEKKWDRRGLLIGSVQSGKTANYTGIIHAASDVGYKIIILIAGSSNLLRQQTQERIEEYYVGRSTKPGTENLDIGIGAYKKDYKHPIIKTDWVKDFVGHQVDVNPFNQTITPIIFVIKKQKTVLENIIKQFQDYQDDTSLPVLVIDDEGDYASINTNEEKDFDGDEEEYSPTTTNKLIRKLLTRFRRRTFLSVTATPFANIFINPDIREDTDLYKDLFPRDFIHTLKAPEDYFGGKKVFGLEDDDLIKEENENSYQDYANAANYISIIEDIVPHLADDKYNEKTGKFLRTVPKPKGSLIENIPLSMKDAICNFILAKSIRSLRGDGDSHASMMINVTVKVDLIERIKDLVKEYVEELETEILNYASLPFETAKQSSNIIKKLHMLFLKSFPNVNTNNKNENRKCNFEWQEIQNELISTIKKIQVKSSSGGSSDTINFSENNNKPKTFIIVGGFTLSRGFTMEGLMVSYLYRTSKAMDTLYQMGRWFGYRQGYEDLCQLYLEKHTREFFVATVKATENLMSQVREMNRLGSSPQDFGMYVEKASENLEISARNKTRSARRVNWQINYSGQQKDITRYSMDERVNERNKEIVKEFIKNNLIKNETEYKHKSNYYYEKVSTEKILEFLDDFEFHDTTLEVKNCLIKYLEDNYKKDTCDVLLYSKGGVESKSNLDFVPFERSTWEEVEKENYVTNRNNKAFSDYSHFFPGINTRNALIDKLKENGFINSHREYIITKNGEKNYRDIFIRYRKKPLFVLGQIQIKLKKIDKKLIIPTIGFQFPYGGTSLSSVRILNKKAQEQMEFPF